MLRKLRPLLFVLQFVVVGLAAAFLISLAWPGAGGLLRSGIDGHRSPSVSPAASMPHASPARAT